MLTTEFVMKVREADTELAMLNDGFSQESIDSIKGVALALAIKELCGTGYVAIATNPLIQRSAEVTAQQFDVPLAIVIDKASRFGALVVDENKDTKHALSFCRMIKAASNQH